MIGADALRGIDRLLGVPACALLTAVRQLGWTLCRPGTRSPLPRRVLFVQLAESGSMVLADPAMRELISRTGARPYCVTFASNRASVSIAGTLSPHQVFAIRTDSLGTLITDASRFLAWTRRERIDTVIDFELFSRLTAVLCLLTGARRRAGFHRFEGVGLYRGNLYTHPVAFNPQLHIAENYRMLVEAVLGSTAPPAPRVPAATLAPRLRPRKVAKAELAAVREKLASRLPGGGPAVRLVMVNANASEMLPQRRWPQEHFVALVRELLARFADVAVLLIGAPEDRATTAAIAGAVREARCVDVAGVFSLEELPALFTLGAAMVSNDSGPAHFASVTDLPLVVLFGPETPVLFRPLGNATVLSAGLACSPCVHVGNQRRSGCTDNQCMKRISVAEVLAATQAALESRVISKDSEDTRRLAVETSPR